MKGGNGKRLLRAVGPGTPSSEAWVSRKRRHPLNEIRAAGSTPRGSTALGWRLAGIGGEPAWRLSPACHSVPRMSHQEGLPAAHHRTPCDGLAVGAQLKILRKAALTQAELGSHNGTTESAIPHRGSGNKRLSLAALSRAASALGCAVELSYLGKKAS